MNCVHTSRDNCCRRCRLTSLIPVGATRLTRFRPCFLFKAQAITDRVRTIVLTLSVIAWALNKKQGLNLVNLVAPTGINEVNRQRLQQLSREVWTQFIQRGVRKAGVVNQEKRLTCKLHNRNKTKKQGKNLVYFVAPTGIEPVFHA